MFDDHSTVLYLLEAGFPAIRAKFGNDLTAG